jgi:hypothetical protein
MTPARMVTGDTAGIELAINALQRGTAIGVPTETVENKWGQGKINPAPFR